MADEVVDVRVGLCDVGVAESRDEEEYVLPLGVGPGRATVDSGPLEISMVSPVLGSTTTVFGGE